jgi:prolyl oligopeptidase
MHDLGTGAKRSQVASGLIGSFAQLTGRRHHNEFFFKLVGFSNPGLVYRYEFARPEKGEQLWRSTVVQGLKPDEFTTEQVSTSAGCCCPRSETTDC